MKVIVAVVVLAILAQVNSGRIPSSRVINGLPVRGSAGSVVAVKTDSGRTCTGSIITDAVILTAADCLTNVAYVDVVAGVFNGGHSKLEENVFVRSDKFVIHEEWDSTTHSNDVALVVLPDKLALNTQTLFSVALNNGSHTEMDAVTYQGWGKIDPTNDKPSFVLSYARAVVHPNSHCKKIYHWITEKHICMESFSIIAGNSGPCKGDEGGPVFDYVNGKDLQVGITTSVMAARCSTKGPFVFTRASSYYDWVQAQIANLK